MPESREPLTDISVVELSDEERELFRSEITPVTANPYQAFDPFIDQVRERPRALPERMRSALADLRAARGPGALLVRNLPIPHDLPPTPRRSFAALPEIRAVGTEAVLACAADALGEPFSYLEWDSGHLVHNKYPIQAHRDLQFGSNAVEFLLHTETPFRDVSPDYLALLCLRADPTGRAKTRVADIRRVVGTLSEAEIAVLARPRYAFETDNPVVVLDGRGLTEPQPIISERDGTRVIEYVGDLVATDAESQRALDDLGRRVLATAVDIALERGDLLVLDNGRVVHGRNAIVPAYDGTDRWLQRMLVTTRLLDGTHRAEGRLVSDRRYANYPTDYRQALRQPAARS
ncbi:L-asparagine oxygenase [Sphaerisporangium rufum]|uniref:L-asparagine oxygenase n=1 Tax=Sphaerisporangium rufum TaxID=1381558 RepID=A0A919R3S7_9ACTN|nr:TauD/TfdA family dioxygenase [Sphaerisporangium rufum]GII77830.1 L-asparagine oxygenase [Sphaerisporangium rufum]